MMNIFYLNNRLKGIYFWKIISMSWIISTFSKRLEVRSPIINHRAHCWLINRSSAHLMTNEGNDLLNLLVKGISGLSWSGASNRILWHADVNEVKNIFFFVKKDPKFAYNGMLVYVQKYGMFSVEVAVRFICINSQVYMHYGNLCLIICCRWSVVLHRTMWKAHTEFHGGTTAEGRQWSCACLHSCSRVEGAGVYGEKGCRAGEWRWTIEQLLQVWLAAVQPAKEITSQPGPPKVLDSFP